ncbi:NmrA family transcriptional regulator [Actinomyces naeslundii]|uniref:NmrA family transcriptional regulator n=1 Tax=Actinomyces naeslundii TaxID=1655 RepID=A0ABX3F3W5_ACTNA|nr:NAD(P)H-binding protein [Actinomyces naeslundii]OLO83915.1 NmrA family transcriptional regulator [Actinomyces naeslundii]OLO87131.1 NmrA family transcriptional regulator [Actinomyces naeslundii]
MIMVTGASGRLSSAVLAELRARGVPAVGGSRTPSAGQRHVDFSAPDSLDFNGVDTLLLVSAGAQEDDRQIAFNRAAVEVAERDGVSHLVYTSLTGAGDHLSMALPHRVTERIIMASGMTWTILRNGVYAEILAAPLSWEKQGEALRIVSPLGDGAVAAVVRRDLARAAASVLRDPGGHEGRVYELVGNRTVSVADVAGRLGWEVRDISLGDYRQLLAGGGVPAFRLPLMLSIASVIRHGFLAGTGGDLPRLLDGDPMDPLSAAVKAVVGHRSGPEIEEN